MKKISIYIVLILVFLALSKSFSPSEQNSIKIPNERVFSDLFLGAPLSIILVDSFTAGFLIKTFYQKYRIIYGFRTPETVVVRTSQIFWEKNLPNLGMSLFRRDDQDGSESVVPTPPGALYIGDNAFGYWERADSGEKIWRFHRAYRNFPKIFRWGDFVATREFYDKLMIHLKDQIPFYGLHSEFGTDGSITKQNWTEHVKSAEIKKRKFREHIKKYPYLPPYKK